MNSVASIIPSRTPPKQPKMASGGVNSPFNDAVDRAIQLLKLDGKFAMWCGRLRGFSPQQIGFLASQAREGKNPAALFSFLIKKYRLEREKWQEQ